MKFTGKVEPIDPHIVLKFQKNPPGGVDARAGIRKLENSSRAKEEKTKTGSCVKSCDVTTMRLERKVEPTDPHIVLKFQKNPPGGVDARAGIRKLENSSKAKEKKNSKKWQSP